MLKFIITLLIFFVTVCGINAQPSIKEVLNRLEDRSLPYVGLKSDNGDNVGVTGVRNENNVLIGRLYTNVQLTEWREAFEHDAECPISFHQFILPNSSNSLLTIRFGIMTDWKTDVLLSVSEDGEVLDQMPVTVFVHGAKYDRAPVMQYSITSDAKVIVYRLEPTTSESIDLLDFTSFVACRVDRTYEIDSSGKFILVDTKCYAPRTYTKEQLRAEDYNIFYGDEIPL